MNDSRHFPAGLYRNIPNLGLVWDPYEEKNTYIQNSQCGPGHWAPYQYNRSIHIWGGA